MAISRAQLAKELEPGLNALFGLEYNRYENEHGEIFEEESSDRAFEEEVMLGGFSTAPVKGEGTAISFDDAQETYTARYTHETIALAFSITEAHPSLSGNQTNLLATAADLNETSLEQMLIEIAGMTDERGLKIAVRGMKLIIPKELQFIAERVINSNLRSGTADNDTNAMKSMGMLPEGAVVNHFLTDSDAYFIKTDAPNGFKFFNRSPIKTAMEGDFDTGNMRFKARERYSFGVSDWRTVFGTPGA